jgi:molecular chaperone DnaK (HSP70)
MAAMGYVLGVDLGTTFTAAAVERDGRVEMVTLGTEGASIPSMVFLDVDGSTLIGEAARRRALREPGRTAREFKRRLGDPTPLLVGGSPLSADVLMAKLLAAVVATVTEREGAVPDAVAVSHPANWGPYKTDLLRNAARVAGLGEVHLVPEPVAAATQYAATDRMDPGTVVAVYDLGGGTFDAAALRKSDVGFEALGTPEGIERLGGIDFDAAVIGFVDQALGGAVAALDAADDSAAGAAARLHRECVEAKEALSEDLVVDIGVYLPDRVDQVRLTRAELEQLIRPAVAETVAALRRAVASAGLEPGQVDRVLLVGGSSRIPLVAEMVGSELGRPVSVDAHPKHTIAMGAARLAAAAAATPTSGSDPVVAPVAVPSAAATAAPSPTVAPTPTPAPTPAPAADPGPDRTVSPASPRRPTALVAGGVLAVVLVLAVVAVLVLGGGGNGDGGDADGAVGVQLIDFSTEWDGAACTASWSFDGTFAEGDQLWVSAGGAVRAQGQALTSDDVSGQWRFDQLSLVRDGTVVQTWTPTAAGC